jgi:hypothetical protein
MHRLIVLTASNGSDAHKQIDILPNQPLIHIGAAQTGVRREV